MKTLSRTIIAFLFFAFFVNTQDAKSQSFWTEPSELAKKMAEEPKAVMIYVYAPYCGWCKRMTNETLKDTTIQLRLDYDYYCVMVNGESKNPIHFNGKTYQFNRKSKQNPGGIHSFISHFIKEDEIEYPTCFFFDSNYKLIKANKGFATPGRLNQILDKLEVELYRD